MPPSLHATLLVTLGSALGAVAVLRLAHEADLAALCYGRDDAFLAGDSPAPTAPETARNGPKMHLSLKKLEKT